MLVEDEGGVRGEEDSEWNGVMIRQGLVVHMFLFQNGVDPLTFITNMKLI